MSHLLLHRSGFGIALLTPWEDRALYRKGETMILTAEQQRMLAMVYEKAAADTSGVPAPQRAAFARKARRFHTLARIAAKIEATKVVKSSRPLRFGQSQIAQEGDVSLVTKAKYPTLAERLEKARAACDLLSGEGRSPGV